MMIVYYSPANRDDNHGFDFSLLLDLLLSLSLSVSLARYFRLGLYSLSVGVWGS